MGFIWSVDQHFIISITWLRQGGESYLPLATGHGDIDEAAGVCDSLLRAALWRLLLLLWLDLVHPSVSLVPQHSPCHLCHPMCLNDATLLLHPDGASYPPCSFFIRRAIIPLESAT